MTYRVMDEKRCRAGSDSLDEGMFAGGVGLCKEKWYNIRPRHERRNAHAETE